jgi:hypothetical protein
MTTLTARLRRSLLRFGDVHSWSLVTWLRYLLVLYVVSLLLLWAVGLVMSDFTSTQTVVHVTHIYPGPVPGW